MFFSRFLEFSSSWIVWKNENIRASSFRPFLRGATASISARKVMQQRLRYIAPLFFAWRIGRENGETGYKWLWMTKRDEKWQKSGKSVIRTHPPSRMLWFFVASVWSDVAQFRITISWHRLSPHSAPPFLAMGYWRGGTMARKRSATSAQLWRLYTVQFFKQRPWRRIR